MKMHGCKVLLLLMLIFMQGTLSACAPLLAGAAGAAIGHEAAEREAEEEN